MPGIVEESYSMTYKSGYLSNNYMKFSKLLEKYNNDHTIKLNYFKKWFNKLENIKKQTNLLQQLSNKKNE